MQNQTILIQNILQGESYDYASSLIDNLSTKFNVLTPKRHNFEPHFTLKYKFDTEQLEEIESLLEKHLKNTKKAPVKIGGFGTFKEGDVIYLNIELSSEAKILFKKIYKILETIPEITWSENDKENLTFHATLCVSCKDKSIEIMDYLMQREKHFCAHFDNVSILRLFQVENGNNIWKKHKQIFLK